VVKFFSRWQRPEIEDHLTALVLGFMRHAPVALACSPWLSEVLGRPVRVESITVGDLWPNFPTLAKDGMRTEPDAVLRVEDGSPLLVVIEVKPDEGAQSLAQLRREAVDVAAATGAGRVAVVMLDAGLGPPPEMVIWTAALTAEVPELLGRPCALELRHSSFRQVAATLAEAGRRDLTWAAYAEDVTGQLRRKGLTGYDGAPIIDEEVEMGLREAAEAFNVATRQTRELALAVCSHPRWHAAQLAPTATLHRGANTAVLPGSASWFEQRAFLVVSRVPDGPKGAHVVFGVDLTPRAGGPSQLVAGAALLQCSPPEAWYWLHHGKGATAGGALAAPVAELPFHEMGEKPDRAEWRLDRREWLPGAADDDLAWCLDRVECARRYLTEHLPSPPP
jgi:hypothetical protein